MIKTIIYGVAILLTFNIYSQTELTNTVSVDAAGWKRVAQLNGASGRGYHEVILMTTGGDSAPRVAKISWLKGWSSYGGLNLVSISDNGYWTEARITYDGTKAYLEVNFTKVINSMNIYFNQSAWVGGNIFSGALPNGGDTVILTSKFGRLNFGEDDFFLAYNGNVGIGTTAPDEKLAINGKIHAKEVRVDLTGWSDFVFESTYNLPSLNEVEIYIKEKGHLKDIPSAKEVLENGILIGEMDARLLQKIEELMLYTIQQEKELKSKESKIKSLEDVLKEQDKRLKKIEKLISNE
ncbi:hypothetical protein [Flavivirga sp. 57AJ16]|uniref:hypothetical protein n=1 Tax=Flavivirga sp. 57AJ16 TaxID=3025307 RepID=UPI0023650D3B|nr:hypothetical protein [Flavivirga sp. 57AJ16]MDD7886029.1 hypothetical protein [Flavivirga sp. 57AJ16]